MKAVVLARGKGTRMQAQDSVEGLTEAQSRAADLGLKAMMPFRRPFLDYVLGALADAEFRDVCLVVAPDDAVIREYYAEHQTVRVRVSFAVQEDPRGTADALLAASSFVAGDAFVSLNADNHYPATVLRKLASLDEPGLPAFHCSTLIRRGNIEPERVQAFAILDVAADGYLVDIREKPDAPTVATFGNDFLVSMNCWRFDASIFDACRAIPLSERGELELPNAVRYAMAAMGCRFRVVVVDDGVLDLSRRRDIPTVARLLGSADPRP